MTAASVGIRSLWLWAENEPNEWAIGRRRAKNLGKLLSELEKQAADIRDGDDLMNFMR